LFYAPITHKPRVSGNRTREGKMITYCSAQVTRSKK